MESRREFVSPEKGARLFEQMRKAVDGEIPLEEITPETDELKPMFVEKKEIKIMPNKNFTNGMSAYAAWQQEQEDRQDDRRKAA